MDWASVAKEIADNPFPAALTIVITAVLSWIFLIPVCNEVLDLVFCICELNGGQVQEFWGMLATITVVCGSVIMMIRGLEKRWPKVFSGLAMCVFTWILIAYHHYAVK